MYWFDVFCTYWTPWNFSAFLLILFVYWWWRNPCLPPGPRGVPFFGVLPFLGEQPQETFRKWARHYGSVMSVRIGTKDFIFLNTFSSIEKVTTARQNIALGILKKNNRKFLIPS